MTYSCVFIDAPGQDKRYKSVMVCWPYPEMSGQLKGKLINSRFANQRIFPYNFP